MNLLLVGAGVTFALFALGWLLFGITSYSGGSLPQVPVAVMTAAAVPGVPPGHRHRT